VVERDVLLENHDQMLDRGRGMDAVGIVAIVIAIMIVGNGARAADHQGQSGYETKSCGQTHRIVSFKFVDGKTAGKRESTSIAVAG
jgi:hypothetical protein